MILTLTPTLVSYDIYKTDGVATGNGMTNETAIEIKVSATNRFFYQ